MHGQWPQGARAGFTGAYSLHAHSLDEAITRDIVRGRRPGEPAAAGVRDRCHHLRLNLRLVLEARAWACHGAGAEHERHGRAPGHSD